MPERYIGQSFGKYQVQSLIGSGGFAWVFRGYDPELEIPVAIKVLKPHFAGDATLVDRFRREASTAAKLRHPNIIKIYAVGREGDAVYFVMDYLPTGLADKLEATNTLPEEYVLRVGIDVARALDFAHREGVIHRDIKVDNILFDAHGNAVVADFGIARAVSGYTQHTGTNMVVGTPQYFAPEQARAKPLDGRADIYSLGVTLYRASTGRLPFEGDDWYEIARQHVEEPPPTPRSIRPGLSAEFERVLQQCLEKSPSDRPATGEQLAEELEQIVAQHKDPTLARTLTVPAHVTAAKPIAAIAGGDASHQGRRVSWILALSGIAVVALGAVTWPYVRERIARAAAADSSAAADVPPKVIGPAEGSAVDSPKTKSDSLAPSGRPRSRLVVSVPAGAELKVNGAVVPLVDGAWRPDSVEPGPYALHTSVTSIPGCSSASIDSTIRLSPTNSRTVKLSPQPCGTLEIQALARNARNDNPVPGTFQYRLEAGGNTVSEGDLPLAAPIVLPVGKYHLTIRMRQLTCTEYFEDLTIAANLLFRTSPRILCYS